jgi:hypothetical protein
MAMSKDLLAPLDAGEVETLRQLLRKLAGLEPDGASR